MSAATRILGVLSVGLLVLAPLSGRLHLLPARIFLLLVPIAALIGLLALGLGSYRLLRKPTAEEKRRSLTGLACGLVPVVFFANVFVSARGLPSIHDVTTDTRDPPVFVAAPNMPRDAQNSLSYESKNASLQQGAFPDLHSLRTPENATQAFEHAKQTVAKLGWEIYAQDATSGRIEAVDTTPLFGFKDDVVIRIRSAGSGSLIDLRSVSRIGQGDLGANAKRIRKFVAAYGPGASFP